LAFAIHARPQARLLSGRLLFLDEARSLVLPADRPARGWPALTLAEHSSWSPVFTLSQQALDAHRGISAPDIPVTAIIGCDRELARFLAAARSSTRKCDLRDMWPQLEVVLSLRRSYATERYDTSQESGGPLWLDACLPLEGPVGVTDPRHGLLRLVPDLGVYLEFIPTGQLGAPDPLRLTVREVEGDRSYALAITSPAGLWACLLGLEVRVECRRPLLFRLLPSPVVTVRREPALAPPAKVAAHAPSSLQPPHLRNGGSLVARPGKFARPPLSLRGDRT
jgi:hypothetical protein